MKKKNKLGMGSEGWVVSVKRFFSILNTHPSSRGFTILEMLLAVTLFTIVMTSSYGIFSMGMQIWRRTQGAVIVERNLFLTFERMGKDFRTTVLLKGEGLSGEGNSTSVILPSMMKIPNNKGEEHLHYSVKQYKWDSRSRSLCINEIPIDDVRHFSSCRVLVTDVVKMKFKYWMNKGVSDSYSWYDRFSESDPLPQAIQLTIELNPKFKGEKSFTKREYEKTFLIPVGGAKADLSENFGVVEE